MNTISVEEAEDIVFGQEYVAYQRGDDHRWYTEMLVVFEMDNSTGPLMGFYYLEPASEIQEDQDRFESDPVEIFPVERKTKTITIYEKIKNAKEQE